MSGMLQSHWLKDAVVKLSGGRRGRVDRERSMTLSVTKDANNVGPLGFDVSSEMKSTWKEHLLHSEHEKTSLTRKETF